MTTNTIPIRISKDTYVMIETAKKKFLKKNPKFKGFFISRDRIIKETLDHYINPISWK